MVYVMSMEDDLIKISLSGWVCCCAFVLKRQPREQTVRTQLSLTNWLSVQVKIVSPAKLDQVSTVF
jgi:hypothetical protein